ncbi:TPA: helix-turn-helix transcriptional regulator [Enterococcus faecalis]|uniref:TetR/AcrR family transcriptional regulator n=1 Tax=Enterococcus faecalis TaxID=1351 RepID=UPI001CB44A26|nr:TetR/AcrR family transcriptional regulator [Enterococcus faecalis]HBI3768912.1 helix-turn-helix transcriptional regulator [Enterococcus faecalis]
MQEKYYKYASETFNNLNKEKKDELLFELLKCFGEKGYDGTTSRYLASNSILKAGSLYQYFFSKENMLFVTMDFFFEIVNENIYKKIDSFEESIQSFQKILLLIGELVNSKKELFIFYYRISVDQTMYSAFFKRFSIENSKFHNFIIKLVNVSKETEAYLLDNMLLGMIFIHIIDYSEIKNRIFVGEKKPSYALYTEILSESFYKLMEGS